MLGGNDELQRRAARLGLDRADELVRVQTWLEANYPGQARATSLNGGVLRLITPNASVASDLRLRQHELLANVAASQVGRLSIQVGDLT